MGTHTRAEILSTHSKRENVEFVISTADDNCKHAFCVRDSDVMAKHVLSWIKDL